MKSFDNNKGFVVVTANRSGGETGKLHIRKFSSQGIEIWNNIYSVSEFRSISTVNVTSSNGILVCGHGRNINGNLTSVIISVDAAGTLLWARTVAPTNGNSGAYSATETSNKEILMYGYHYPLGGGDSRKYLLRLNKDGEVIQAKSLYSSYRWGVAEASKEGGLFISDLTGVHKYDETGDLIWYVRWPAGFEGTQFLAVADDNSFYAIMQGAYSVLVKLNSQGKILWQKRIVNTYSDLGMIGNNPLIFVFGNIAVLEEDGSVKGTIKPSRPYLEIIRDDAGRTWLGSLASIDSKKGILLAQTNDLFNFSCAVPGDPIELIPENFSFVQGNYSPVPLNMESTLVTGTTTPAFSNTDTLCHKKQEMPGLGADTIICEGDSLELDAGPSGLVYNWSTGSNSRKIWIKGAGTYWVKVTYPFGEEDSDTIVIQSFPKPLVDWAINDTDFEPGDTLIIHDTGSSAQQRMWYVNNRPLHGNNPLQFVIPGNGNYHISLFITDSTGCTNERNHHLNVAYFWVHIPNAFSPNNDGLNDGFGPEGYGITYRQIIFNRWGEIIFEGENTPWDGGFKGRQATDGIYFYRTKIKTVSGKYIHRNGYFHLLR